MLVVNTEGNNTSAFDFHQRIALVITKIIRKTGNCTPENLLQEGFLEEDIKKCWPMANALAAIELSGTKPLPAYSTQESSQAEHEGNAVVA